MAMGADAQPSRPRHPVQTRGVPARRGCVRASGEIVFVMAGLVPAIHVFRTTPQADVDARHKAGHDGNTMTSKPYRPNVGIALFNAAGRVLIARRFKDDGPEIVLPGFEWQMPQGGIDPSEDPGPAALRELYEETGVTSVAYLGETADWLTYDFPPYDGPPHRLAAFRGQRQKWFAFRFTGDEREIIVADV